MKVREQQNQSCQLNALWKSKQIDIRNDVKPILSNEPSRTVQQCTLSSNFLVVLSISYQIMHLTCFFHLIIRYLRITRKAFGISACFQPQISQQSVVALNGCMSITKWCNLWHITCQLITRDALPWQIVVMWQGSRINMFYYFTSFLFKQLTKLHRLNS